jgi:hypothetical protein
MRGGLSLLETMLKTLLCHAGSSSLKFSLPRRHLLATAYR